MLKIFSVMEKINKFSNQMAGSGLSSDYGKEETKRKDKHKKHLDKLEQKKKRLQREIDNIKKKNSGEGITAGFQQGHLGPNHRKFKETCCVLNLMKCKIQFKING